ncbi:hypothetical protein D1AOALGA4SA_5318 [Olavius algarvensis Delta 1 endosymbiont]|nr:hypothetical protein D1AOALGA4SA_5318 [Olavius algarvensis Delta 1 endosymbiont]
MQFETKNNPVAIESVRERALDIVANSTARIAPIDLEKRLSAEYRLKKRQIKSIIRNLVADGELVYTYEFGRTFLERSFAGPVRISEHIVLLSPGRRFSANPDDVAVKIKPGASFGAGNHPSTRLAIRGIEFALLSNQSGHNKSNAGVLDIGTGSGVLLITAVLCGMKSGLGIDIDACARVEAAENVKINDLTDRIAISGQSVEHIRQRFSVILANLRYPSLKKMLFQLNEMASADCFLIFSGIRDSEVDDLLKVYKQIHFEKIWTESELGWSGVVLRRA